jgi:hypothetical protein
MTAMEHLSSLRAALRKEENPATRMDLIEAALCPPEPHLLDTCVLYNLDWIDRLLESKGNVTWDDAAISDLEHRYGAELAKDLIDLGILYKEFENRSGYPWLVSRTAQGEVSPSDGVKGVRLGSLLEFFRGHQDDWCDEAYPGLAKGLLFPTRRPRVSPLLLRGLGVTSVDEIHLAAGPLSFLQDEGDRLVAAEALIANVPVVLTTDRKTFWRHRAGLDRFGLAVMRPTELLELYEPYWEALDEESTRRRASQL